MSRNTAMHSVAKEALQDGRFQIKVFEGNARPRIVECQDAAQADRVYYLEFEKQRLQK